MLQPAFEVKRAPYNLWLAFTADYLVAYSLSMGEVSEFYSFSEAYGRGLSPCVAANEAYLKVWEMAL